MFVMSVKDALELVELRHHQFHVRFGTVVEHQPGMVVIFVTHQWAGKTHPDQDMEQFRVLQQALRNLIEGMPVKMCPFTSTIFKQSDSYLTADAAAGLVDAYIWYDFFCIPQLTDFIDNMDGSPGGLAQDHRMIRKIRSTRSTDRLGMAMTEVQEQQKDAVSSIPAYVQACDHFFVVAPTMHHSDSGQCVSLETWGRRGWCRVETGCHYMSRKKQPAVIAITKKDRVVETYPFAWIHNQPVQGEFTCEADRKLITRVIGDLCRERISCLRRAGQEFEPRFLTAMLPWLAPGVVRKQRDLSKWLCAYGFKGEDKEACLGWRPIHFAALEGNMPILEKLVELGASVNRKTGAGEVPPLGTVDIGLQIPGMTPLMCAAFYIPTGADAVRVAQFLLKSRADLSMAAGGGDTALHLAAAGASSDGRLVGYLLDCKADIECVNEARETPLLKACFLCPSGSKFPNFGNVRELVRRGASLVEASSIRPIQPTPLRVAAGTADVDEVEFLLDHSADINGAKDYTVMPVDIEMSAFPCSIRESSIKDSVRHLYGGTPLHWAAYFGNARTAELLMARGADPALRNTLGKTARDVAEEEAQDSVLRAFDSHFAQQDYPM